MQQLLNPIALAAVEELLPDVVDGNLSNLCMWADDVRHTKGYEWSAPLHYIDTPNKRCSYSPISTYSLDRLPRATYEARYTMYPWN